MYFVTLAGRNYNLAIFTRAGAPGGTAAAFSTRLETCRGPIETIDCNITIDFDWEAGGAGSGTGQVTIFSGSSGNSTIPAPGNALTYIGITNITSDCTKYNSIFACPGLSPTTTTTTTTSTTTTTTTVSPTSYTDPAIKHDQYSSSYSDPTWTNIGTSGSLYNLTKYASSNINTGGSGTGAYLGMTGSMGVGELEQELYPAMYSNFINLNNISFSYAIIFRVESPALGYTVSSVRGTAGFGISGGADSLGTFIQPYVYSSLAEKLSDPIIRIPNTPKWYLGVLTFDKTATASTAAKFYLNLSPTNFVGTNEVPSPSTFFTSDPYYYNLGFTLNPVKIAAAIFWQNIVLTQSQIQNLYNEYNSRYSLG